MSAPPATTQAADRRIPPIASSRAPRAGEAGERDTLTRRASFTALASVLDYSAKMIVGLVVTPILVSHLGRSLYGVWEMLNRLVNHMVATDGRPTEALRLVVASHQETADAQTQRRHVGSALVVWLVFFPLLTAAGVALVWLAPAIITVSPALHPTLRLACALLVVSTLAATLAAVPESALRGMNLGYKQMGLQAGLNLAGGGLMVGAVLGGLGLAGLAASQIALAILTGMVFWVLARRYVAWFGSARPHRAQVRSMLAVSIWLVLADVISKLLLASDVLVLGMVISPATVTTYVLTGYAAKVAVGVLSFTASAAMPGLGGLIGRGEVARARALRREMLAATWWLVTAIGCTILLWNRAFLGLWVGPGHDAGSVVNLLIVLLATQTAVIRTDAYIIDAALQPRLRVVVSAAAAATTVTLAFLGTRWLGLAGLCLGVLTGRGVQSIAFPLLVRRCLPPSGGPQPSARARWIRPLAITAIMFAATTLLGDRLVVAHWLGWIAGSGASFLGLLILAFFLGMDQPTRHQLRSRLAHAVRCPPPV